MSENYRELEIPVIPPQAVPKRPEAPSTYGGEEINCVALKQRLEQFQLWLAAAFNAGGRFFG